MEEGTMANLRGDYKHFTHGWHSLEMGATQ